MSTSRFVCPRQMAYSAFTASLLQDRHFYRCPTAQSVVQKGDINALGKSPNVPGKKKLEYGYAQFYAPLKVSEKNDSRTKRGLNGAYALFSLVFLKQ